MARWGELTKAYGQISTSISHMQLKAGKGIVRDWYNVFSVYVVRNWYMWAVPFGSLYLVREWANAENEKTKRKAYQHDE